MTQAFAAKPPPLVSGDDGVIRIGATRVQLETVVESFDSGSTAEEIAQQYPSLRLAEVYAVISYALENEGFVREYVAGRRAAAGAIRAEIEVRQPMDGIRARLLARRK